MTVVEFLMPPLGPITSRLGIASKGRFADLSEVLLQVETVHNLESARKQFPSDASGTQTYAPHSVLRYDSVMATNPVEEALLTKLRQLRADQQKEALDFVNFLVSKRKRHRKNMYGILKDSGLSVSEEDVAEARKEMWGSFPREEFFK
jgi:hypothetical protein